MKKIFLSFAIAAMATIAFNSCKGNGEKKAEGENTEATEQVEEPAAGAQEKAQNADEGQTFDKEHFTVTMPAGWEVRNDINDQVSMKKPDPSGENAYSGLGAVRVLFSDDNAEAHYNEKFTEGCEKMDDVTVGDVTYKCFKDPAGNGPFVYLIAPQGEGCIEVYIETLDVNDADVQAIINSITQK